MECCRCEASSTCSLPWGYWCITPSGGIPPGETAGNHMFPVWRAVPFECGTADGRGGSADTGKQRVRFQVWRVNFPGAASDLCSRAHKSKLRSRECQAMAANFLHELSSGLAQKGYCGKRGPRTQPNCRTSRDVRVLRLPFDFQLFIIYLTGVPASQRYLSLLRQSYQTLFRCPSSKRNCHDHPHRS
jgi:hypothetical protein